MAYISYNKLWESEFENMVFKKDKIQDVNNIQLKLEVIDAYTQDEKIPTKFELSDDTDVI